MAKRGQLERQKIGRVKDIGDLEIEKRGKERQIKNANSSMNGEKEQTEMLERQLQRELKDKEEEVDRLKAMIRDKKLEMETREYFKHEDNGEGAGEGQYEKITKEIDQVKVMILDMRASQAGVTLPADPSN